MTECMIWRQAERTVRLVAWRFQIQHVKQIAML